MATTLESLSDILAATQREVNDLGVITDGLDNRLSVTESDIASLQDPPTGVPSELLAWYDASHTTREVDAILDTVLTDFDSRISGHDTDITTISDGLATEVTDRTTADTALQASIDDLQVQVTDNLATLTQEISDRSALSASVATQYDLLNSRIDDAFDEIDSNNSDSDTATDSLSDQIATSNLTLQTMQTQVNQLIGIGVDPAGAQAAQITALTIIANDAATATALETTNRVAADSALQATVITLSASLSGIQTSLDAEVDARSDKDDALAADIATINASISGFSGSIAAETAARVAADATLTSNVLANTTNISGFTSSLSDEQNSRIDADAALQILVDDNTADITVNTSDISDNSVQITSINSKLSVTVDGGGYVSGYRIVDESLAGAAFRLRDINNDVRMQNPGYVGQYIIPVSVLAFSPPVTYDTNYGAGTSNDFHGTDANDYTRLVNVYSPQTVAINGSCFKGTDYTAGGDLNRLGQILTTFKVDFSGTVNRYLSLWYRIKDAPGDTTQRWHAVAMANNTTLVARDYEPARGQAVVQISVAVDKVIEFGLTTLSTVDASISDSTKAVIYGGSVSVTALNMVTIT